MTTHSRARTLLLGNPGPHRNRPPRTQSRAGRFIGWTALVLAGIFTGITATQLYFNPAHPLWWTFAWVWAGLVFILGGHLLGLLPRGPAPNALLAAVYVLGFFVVPFGMEFIQHWNVGVGVVVTPFAVGWALALKHYMRAVAAHPKPTK